MQFNPGAFNAFLASMGQQVQWRRSFVCPCAKSGTPDPKHALCLGKGHLWDEPIGAVVGVTSQQASMELIQAGQYDSGDMVMTIPENCELWDLAGQYDRIMLLNSSDVFSQSMIHGSPTERLLFKPKSITRVMWLHPTTKELVTGGIPDVDANGNLTWADGEPPPGATYSLTGDKFDEYFIFGPYNSDRNEHSGYRLPKKSLLRKFDLLGR